MLMCACATSVVCARVSRAGQASARDCVSVRAKAHTRSHQKQLESEKRPPTRSPMQLEQEQTWKHNVPLLLERGSRPGNAPVLVYESYKALNTLILNTTYTSYTTSSRYELVRLEECLVGRTKKNERRFNLRHFNSSAIAVQSRTTIIGAGRSTSRSDWRSS